MYGILLQRFGFGFDVFLDFGEGIGTFYAVVTLEEAAGMGAAGIVLHAEYNGMSVFGVSPNLIELKSHEGFDEGGFAGGLVSYHDYGLGVELFFENPDADGGL